MDFQVIDDPNTFQRIVVCRYYDLQGYEKQRHRVVGVAHELDHLNYSVALDYIQERMKREVRDELGEQAIQIQEQNMVGIGTQLSGGTTQHQTFQNYVNLNSNYWDNNLTGGTTAGIGGNMAYVYPYAPAYVNGWKEPAVPEIEIEFPLGKRMLTMKKKLESGKILVTMEDIGNAISGARDQFKFNILTNRAERRAEDLLRSMISEIDFRNYKQQGFFVCRQGNKLFRIYKDKNKWVDMWESQEKEAELIWQPKNRLCTHTETRELPDADEALSKLLLARSGKLIEHANLHSIDGTRGLVMPVLKHEDDLILV